MQTLFTKSADPDTESNKCVPRAIWVILLLVIVCGMCYEVYGVIKAYNENPTATNVGSVALNDFPLFGFCPEEFVDARKALELGFDKDTLSLLLDMLRDTRSSLIDWDSVRNGLKNETTLARVKEIIKTHGSLSQTVIDIAEDIDKRSDTECGYCDGEITLTKYVKESGVCYVINPGAIMSVSERGRLNVEFRFSLEPLSEANETEINQAMKDMGYTIDNGNPPPPPPPNDQQQPPTESGSNDQPTAGGSEPTGTGGSEPTGTGGSEPTGTGGTEPTGTGGSEPTGTGGSEPTGTGGSEPTGTGGSEPTGTGGSEPTGTGGSEPTGTGGSEPTGDSTKPPRAKRQTRDGDAPPPPPPPPGDMDESTGMGGHRIEYDPGSVFEIYFGSDAWNIDPINKLELQENQDYMILLRVIYNMKQSQKDSSCIPEAERTGSEYDACGYICRNKYYNECGIDCTEYIGAAHDTDTPPCINAYLQQLQNETHPSEEWECVKKKSAHCQFFCSQPCYYYSYEPSVLSVAAEDETAMDITVRVMHAEAILWMEEVSTYSWDSFLGNIGGVIGLFCGASIITILHLIQMCLIGPMMKKCGKGGGSVGDDYENA